MIVFFCNFLKNNKHSSFFKDPVSKFAYPNYYNMISNPIDLKTIEDKIVHASITLDGEVSYLMKPVQSHDKNTLGKPFEGLGDFIDGR